MTTQRHLSTMEQAIRLTSVDAACAWSKRYQPTANGLVEGFAN